MLYNLFSTPIAIIEEFLTDQERVKILGVLSELNFGEHGSIENGSSTFEFDADTIGLIDKLITGIDLRQRIEYHINIFGNYYGMNDLIVTNNWINLQNKGSLLKKHCHPNSKLSGVIFLNVDEGSSKLVFENPNPFIHFEDYHNITEYNRTDYNIQPNNNQLIIFPSWLQHSSGYDLNLSNNRTVLSFNSKIIDKI